MGTRGDRVKEGYLRKLPPLAKNPSRKDFRKRWVVLWESCHLAYYMKKDGDLIKEINLLSCTDVQSNYRKPGVIRDAEFAFLLKTPQRDWVFLADSQDEMKAWLHVIQRLRCVAEKEPLPVSHCQPQSPPPGRSSPQHGHPPDYPTHSKWSISADATETSAIIRQPRPLLSQRPFSTSAIKSRSLPYMDLRPLLHEYQVRLAKSVSSAKDRERHGYEDVDFKGPEIFPQSPLFSGPLMPSRILSPDQHDQQLQLDDNYVVFDDSWEKKPQQEVSGACEGLVSSEVKKEPEPHFEGLSDKQRQHSLYSSKTERETTAVPELSGRSQVEHTVKSSSVYQASPILPKRRSKCAYATPVEDLLGDPADPCILKIAELLDQTDDMGNDWRRLWSEILNRSPNDVTIYLKGEGPTLCLLKMWCKMKLTSAATIGQLIKALNKINRHDIVMVIEGYCKLGLLSPESHPLHLTSPQVQEEFLEMQFGSDKRIQLLKTSRERHLVGEQGCLLGSLSNKWIFCVPPGALDYEQEVVVSFYHVTDSTCLESSKFVTGIIEITPHQLTFSKPVELLLHHHLCVEDDSSEVAVLYHSGETINEPVVSLCRLSSIDETVCCTDMRTTLWDDVVHIKTPHVCRFGISCKGKSFIDVWASLFAPERPHPDHFHVRLSLTSQAPRTDDEEAKMMKMYGLVRKSHQRISLRCDQQEKLRIDVQVLPYYVGWEVLGGAVFHQTIAYNEVKDMVIYGKPLKTNDFWFTRGTSRVDVTDFAPVFKFNGGRCVLVPPEFSSKPSKLLLSDSPRRLSSTTSPVTEKTANSIQLQPGTFPESALSMSPSEEIKDTDMFTDGHDMHPSDCDGISDFATRKPQLTTHSLERPIRPSDTQFISGCEYITQHWKEIGWLMLSGSGYTMENIRRDIIKHFLHDPDSVKVIHLIEQWQILKRHRTTARELVDICCHPTVGGVRHQIENSLSYESSSYNEAMCGASNGKRRHSTAAPDLDRVVKAVVKVASDQWRSIGFEMGYTNGQLNSVSEGAPNHSSKLQMIARQKAAAIGKARAAQLLLEVCKRLPDPVYGGVMDELEGM